MIETLEQSKPVASKYAARDRRLRQSERRMVDFFKQNNSEELTAADAAIKFGVTENTARNQLSALAADGVLERVSVYRWRSNT